MPMIPATIVVNDGLSNEDLGESEIETLKEFEQYFSKLSNADIDAERKSMNPTKWVMDMNSNSTKNLSTAAGALWDLGSAQNLDKPNPGVGILEPQMSYSEALKTSLDRIKTVGYELVDVPNVSQETMVGTITSGKALKAIYWPLIVRCKEKMKVWGPALRQMVHIIIQGAMVYPNCIKDCINGVITPVDYEIKIVQNTPLPEDEIEEKTMDMALVEAKIRSRKWFMQKWDELTDDEVQEELEQIALERQIIEDSAMPDPYEEPYPNGNENPEDEEDVPQEIDFSEGDEQ